MPKGAAAKARRKQQRKQQRAHAKQQAQQPQQQSGGGWMSWLLGGDVEHEGGLEGEHELDDRLSKGGLRGEVSTAEEEDEEEGGGSWWDYVPSLSWGAKAEEDSHVHREGDEDNHVDFLTTGKSNKLGAKAGVKGAEAELAYERSAALLEAQGKAGTSGKYGKVGAEGKVALGSAEAGVKGGLKADSDGVEGSLGGEAGIYAAKGEGAVKGGLKVPFVNAMLTGSLSGEGNVGYGLSAEGAVKANTKEGFKASGKVGASMGLGGKVGWGLGLEKADADKGWFE